MRTIAKCLAVGLFFCVPISAVRAVDVEEFSQVVVPLDVKDWTGVMSPKRQNLPDGSLAWDLNGASYVFTKIAKKGKKHHGKNGNGLIPSLTDATTLVITARITTTGSPVFGYGYGPDNPCIGAPTAHPILFSNSFEPNGHHFASWYDELARWWGLVPIPLESTPQGYTIRVPLTDDKWLSVYGKHPNDADPQARIRWNDVLANPGAVGITFGGGCYLSHGVTVTGGTAQFELVDYHFE